MKMENDNQKKSLEEMKILVFDNYDSFTYNLVHLIEKITGNKPDVFRNDKISLDDVEKYDKIILSPGPGIPSEAGLLLSLIERFAGTKSILGVCLGHQAIGEVFGGKLVNLDTVYHGVATTCRILDKDAEIFRDVKEPLLIGRYHSWVVDKENFPSALKITAEDENGYVMAFKHNEYDVTGVQFHPESILTPEGEKILRNWLSK